MRLGLIAILFLLTIQVNSQSITGYKGGDRKFMQFFARELSGLMEHGVRKDIFTYVEISFDSIGQLNKIAFLNTTSDTTFENAITKIIFKTKDQWIRRKNAIPLLIPVLLFDLKTASQNNNNLVLDYNLFVNPGGRKSPLAKQYIFLSPITLGDFKKE